MIVLRYIFAFIAGWAAFFAASFAMIFIFNFNIVAPMGYIRTLLVAFFANFAAASVGLFCARFICDKIVGPSKGNRAFTAIWITALVIAVVSFAGYYMARNDDLYPIFNITIGGAILLAILTSGVYFLRSSNYKDFFD